MAEFMTKEQMDKDYGSKSKTNAALTLGIIGTALSSGVLGGNNGDGCCCGGGNNGGILGNLFGNRGGNGGCCEAKAANNRAEAAMTLAMAQGQMANNLMWANRVQSMEDDASLYANIDGRLNRLNTTDWENRVAGMSDLASYAQINETRLTQMNNRDWENRIASMQDDTALYGVVNKQINDVDNKLSDQVQILTNQSWMRREQDLTEKFDLYTRLDDKNGATNRRICEYALNDKDEKFQLYKMSSDADYALDNKFTKINYEGRIQDLNEKFDLYTRLNNKITDLEKAQAKTETALPLMFELSKCHSERYSDACCCQTQKDILALAGNTEKNLLMTANGLQRQLDHKIDGELKYAYSDLCAPVPSISPLYCAPFTRNGVVPTAPSCGCGCSSNQ